MPLKFAHSNVSSIFNLSIFAHLLRITGKTTKNNVISHTYTAHIHIHTHIYKQKRDNCVKLTRGQSGICANKNCG